MFKKIILVAGVFGTMSVMMAAGCSSSSNSAAGGGGSETDSGSGGKDGSTARDGGGGFNSDGGDTTKDGGIVTPKDGGVVVNPDGGIITHIDAGTGDAGTTDAGTSADGGTVACYDLGVVTVDTTSTAPAAGQNVCTTTQVSAYDTACLMGTSTTTTCQAFVNDAANNGCAICLYGANGGGTPSPVLVGETATQSGINIAGCYAALSTASTTCKLTYTQQQSCEDAACLGCASNADYSACITSANNDTASTGCPAMYPLGSTCITPLNTALANTTIQTKCGSAATTTEQLITTLATTMCGAP